MKAEIEVLSLTATAFGIGQKGLKTVNRMALHRARKGGSNRGASQQLVLQELRTLVLGYFRIHGLAGAGGANAFTDAMLISALKLYPRIKAELVGPAPLTTLELRLLIEEFLVPTAFAIMSRTGLGEVRGLGAEFDGPQSWYLPEDDRPLAAILDRWLLAAGFRTPCGFSRDSTNLKRQVTNWMTGETLPSIEDLDSLAERYRERVAWLDSANAWKARFRLARALQCLWVSAESYFSQHPEARPRSAKQLFQIINAEGIVRDAGGLLANPDIFFAVRLVQQRLKDEGKFEAAVMPKQEEYRRRFPLGASDAEVARYRQRVGQQLDVGHRFVRYLARRGRIPLGPGSGQPSLQVVAKFESYVSSLGLHELRRMRAERRLAVETSRRTSP